jgi:MFS family permease
LIPLPIRLNLAALSIPNYRFFVCGQLISNTGTWAQSVAEFWLILELSHDSGLALGVVTLLQALPMLLLGMWGGVIADRCIKRNLLLVTQIAMCALAALFGLLVLLDTVRMWHVYVLVLAHGVAVAFDQPARQSFVIELVGPEQIANAMAVNSLVYNCARVIGPAVGGSAIGWCGVGPLFLFNSVSFLAAVGALLVMRGEELRTADLLSRGKTQIREALRYVTDRMPLLLLVTLIGITSGFGQTFQMLLPLLTKQKFSSHPSVYGLLSAAVALGALGAVMVAARYRDACFAHLLCAALAFGAFEILMTVMPTYGTSMAVAVPMGIAMVTVNVLASAGMQLGVDSAMRGRAMALFMLVNLTANSVGALLIGAVAQATAATVAIATAGAVTMVGTVVTASLLARRHGVSVAQVLSTRLAGRAP